MKTVKKIIEHQENAENAQKMNKLKTSQKIKTVIASTKNINTSKIKNMKKS